MDEVAHALDAVDVARVITEVDATKGGESAHEVRLPSDGGFDALDIVSSRHVDDSFTRHDDDSELACVTQRQRNATTKEDAGMRWTYLFHSPEAELAIGRGEGGLMSSCWRVDCATPGVLVGKGLMAGHHVLQRQSNEEQGRATRNGQRVGTGIINGHFPTIRPSACIHPPPSNHRAGTAAAIGYAC